MTSEEKINLRERALRLAIEIRNPYSGKAAMYMWAEHIYKFLSSDGLSLHEAEHMAKVASLMDSEIPEPEKSRNEPKEIDWSRPQLVREIDGLRIGITNGKHQGNWFEAEMSYPGIGFNKVLQFLSYPKMEFVYHGEIPQEQKTEGLNFLEAVKLCKSGNNIKRVDWARTFVYFSNAVLYFDDGQPIHFNTEDILATDWQIVK